MSSCTRSKKIQSPTNLQHSNKPPDSKFFLKKCRVCGQALSLYSQRQATNVFKVSSCCKVYGCLHRICAERFSTGVNSSYKFDALTYEDDDSTSLYCYVCRTRCFYCPKKHTLPKSNRERFFIQSCTNCSKWCITTEKCKADSNHSLCYECQNMTEDNVKLNNILPLPCISPITTECDPKKQCSVYDAISVLLLGKYTSSLKLKHYKNYFNLTLTHFDPKVHNIFSLNKIVNDPVDGMFLSSSSVFQSLRRML